MYRMYRYQTDLIIIPMGFNLTGATLTKIFYKKPSKVRGHWIAIIGVGVGVDSTLVYDPVSTDLNVSGMWLFQGQAVINGKTNNGEVVTAWVTK